MPLINVIPGETIPVAPWNVRVPVWRIPGWVLPLWWVVRGLFRVVVLVVRYWWVTAPTGVVVWAGIRYGWVNLASVLVILVAVLTTWWVWHPRSFNRVLGYPVLGRVRGVWVYRRRWTPAVATCGLTTVFDRDRYLPRLVRVRSNRWSDTLTVRLLPGQVPDDWAAVVDRLAYTFRVRDGRVTTNTSRPDLVTVRFMRRDPLNSTVNPLPVPEVPDFTALPLAVREDGEVYHLRLTGTQVLIAGATNSGKGSVIWSLIRALAGGIRSGLVELWVFDPKGGMELAAGAPLFARFSYENPERMAGDLEDAVRVMRERAARLRGVTRQHTPTVDDPLIVVLVDELATLTAYLGDRKLRERIRDALSLLLSQGRAVGVHVVAALQDPRKEVLPFRDLFPTRIGLRLTEDEQCDMVLGDGARNRGAVCDRIPEMTPGIGYTTLAGVREPVRVRFSYLTDTDITHLATTYARRPSVDGVVIA